MKRKIILCDEWEEEKFFLQSAKNDSIIARSPLEARVVEIVFQADGELVFAKNSFPFDRFADFLYSTQTFLQLANFDLKNLS